MRRWSRRNRRRRPLGERLGRVLRACAGAGWQLVRVALVIALAAALPLGIYEGYHALLRSDYFVVSEIAVEGHERLSRAEVLEIAGLDHPRNILDLDARRVAARLEASPWIQVAEVDKELPRSITIRVAERESAGWLYWEELFRVDTAGRIICAGRPAEVDGPIITGIEPVSSRMDGGRSAERVLTALRLARLFEAMGLTDFDDLAEIHYDELLGFALLTRRHGMEIRLGSDRFEERLARLKEVLNTISSDGLGGRYVLLDGEGALTRVAVGPSRPGRGGDGSEEGEDALQ